LSLPTVTLPIPTPTPLSEPFWAAAANGQLVVQRCTNDGHYEWTPQVACSSCLFDSLEWVPVSGRGSIYSFSVVFRPQVPGFPVPYVVAIVELAEGPRMLTQLTDDTPPEDVRVGADVRVRFTNRQGVSLPYFELETS
jgi:uncharacterized OB-fold protein